MRVALNAKDLTMMKYNRSKAEFPSQLSLVLPQFTSVNCLWIVELLLLSSLWFLIFPITFSVYKGVLDNEPNTEAYEPLCLIKS